jgi:signal transduction histidine kinase
MVFAFAARRLSRQLAGPLEQIAAAADKLGAGDLSARAAVGRDVGSEVQRVGNAFDAMAARVESLVRDQRELLGAVSHELRSPLGRARVALEIARDRGSDAASCDRVERELAGVDRILSDLLDVTRAGLSDLRRVRVDLAALLRELAPADDVRVDAESALWVEGDDALLARVVQNLVDNARSHGRGEAPIVVRAAAVDGHARVSVRDHGAGFPPGLLERAFEPFVRGDPARSPSKAAGAGLGLAIVRRVVEAHGGAVGARDASPGAEVWFDVPLAPAPPTM